MLCMLLICFIFHMTLYHMVFLYINNQYCILQCTVYNNTNYYFVYIQLCYFCLFPLLHS